MDTDIRERYRRDGYAVVRKVFDAHEMAALGEAFDRIYRQGLSHPSSYRDHNVFFNLALDPALGKIVRMVQWPSYFDEVLARFRTDSRIGAILAPLIGRDLKQIINQLHWKPPGAARVDFGYHQDIRFRRPREAYRQLDESYVQTGIAVDPHRADNGAMVVFPGSHRLGELRIETTGRVMETEPDADALRRAGIDPDSGVVLELEPGDMALWSVGLVHGSGPNRSDHDRRLYINGYVTAANSDRGEWAFRDGAPVALGDPVLVHYEDLFSRPGPYYLDDI